MNNEQLIALNPVSLPKDIDTHKIIIIIMKKLSVGHYPDDIIYRSNETDIHFTADPFKSGFTKQYRSDQIKIPIMKEGINVCNIGITVKDQIFRVTYKSKIYAEPDENNPFLRHVKTDRVFDLTATSYLRYKDDEEGDELAKFCFPTGDNFYSFIRFFYCAHWSLGDDLSCCGIDHITSFLGF